MGVDYATAERALAARLDERSMEHSRRVADYAVVVAAAYGVDPEKARLAGLLHDWDRGMSHEELLSRAERLEIEMTEVDASRPYLLHASTGAIDVQAAFPELDDDVVEAIAEHTLGAPNMSDLSMVVFLADMLEPHRPHEGFDELRAGIGTVELHELFVRAYAQSIGHLLATRKQIHPRTVQVWNAHAGRESR